MGFELVAGRRPWLSAKKAWSAGIPADHSTYLLERRFDLIVGLMSASIADVFRHMTQNADIKTSAQGSTPESKTGLLGYILERVFE
jgi:hypothetical protein